MGDPNIEWRLGDGSTATLNATIRAYQVNNISGLMQVGFQVGAFHTLVTCSNHGIYLIMAPTP